MQLIYLRKRFLWVQNYSHYFSAPGDQHVRRLYRFVQVLRGRRCALWSILCLVIYSAGKAALDISTRTCQKASTPPRWHLRHPLSLSLRRPHRALVNSRLPTSTRTNALRSPHLSRALIARTCSRPRRCQQPRCPADQARISSTCILSITGYWLTLEPFDRVMLPGFAK